MSIAHAQRENNIKNVCLFIAIDKLSKYIGTYFLRVNIVHYVININMACEIIQDFNIYIAHIHECLNV